MKTTSLVTGIINICIGALAIIGSLETEEVIVILGGIYWIFIGVLLVQMSKIINK